MAVAAEHLYPSPLRYPGGKRKLANFVKLLFLENDLVGSEYVEPYAGGASVALSLLYEEYASHIHINDLNRSVHTFWKVVLERSDELCEAIAAARLDIDEWRRQRAIQDEPNPSDVELAMSTFYLNRTSRSGIIGGGPIGGYEQSGSWRLDARFRKDDLIRRIKRIARFRSRITVTGRDAAEYVREDLPALGGRVFVYLDPPYYVKGVKNAGLYQNFYSHGDHVEIARLVAGLAAPWMVSYDAAAEIDLLYRDFRSVSYDLDYTAHVRHWGAERIFFSPTITPPLVETPANIPASVVADARLAR